MKTMNYEKPEMKVVSLTNSESVANVCWGGVTEEKPHGQNLTWAFYGSDLDSSNNAEEGYIEFIISAGNCQSVSKENVVITYKGAAENSDMKQALLKEAFYEKVTALEAGNGGSNWAEESTITPIIRS